LRRKKKIIENGGIKRRGKGGNNFPWKKEFGTSNKRKKLDGRCQIMGGGGG